MFKQIENDGILFLKLFFIKFANKRFFQPGKPYLVQGLGLFFSQLISLLSINLLISYGTFENYGIWTLIFVITSISMGIMSKALDTDHQRRADPISIVSYIVQKTTIFFPLLLVTAVVALFAGVKHQIILWLSPAFLCSLILDTFATHFRVIGKDFFSVLPRIIPGLTFLVTIFAFELQSITAWCFAYSFSYIFSLLFILLFASNMNFCFMPSSLGEIIKRNRFLMLSLIGTQAYGAIDILIVSQTMTFEEIGRYKLSYVLGTIPVSVFSVVGLVFLSSQSELGLSKSYNKIWEYVRKFEILILFMGVSFVLLIYFFFPLFTHYMLQEARDLRLLICIIGGASIFNGLSMVSSLTLIALQHDRIVSKIVVLVGILHLMCTLILSSILGISGIVLSLVSSNILNFMLLRRETQQFLSDIQRSSNG